MDVSLRKDADAIISASLRAVLPDEAVRRALGSEPGRLSARLCGWLF